MKSTNSNRQLYNFPDPSPQLSPQNLITSLTQIELTINKLKKTQQQRKWHYLSEGFGVMRVLVNDFNSVYGGVAVTEYELAPGVRWNA